ncbi:MAG: FAD-dependent oxidoreductase [Clostridia bacterium]|nr:FAD-dependent oxidoreductase [Clostridia bacterium]
MLNERYDVCIIGAGISGVCAAYELNKRTNLSILVVEQGDEILKRSCPKLKDKSITKCLKCRNCSIMKGFGGAGSFSDGKYNITTEFGGWLSDYISDEEVMEMIYYVDDINMEFGAINTITDDDSEFVKKFSKKALEYDLHLQKAKVKHIGTENNFEILAKMYDFLKSQKRIKIMCNTKISSIEKLTKEVKYPYQLSLEEGKGYIHCQYLIAAPGRSGSVWFSEQCQKLGIKLSNNQVDIGVRVELPAEIMEEVTDELYEAKLTYLTKCHKHRVRTFCMNPYGYVVNENVDGIITVNGHSYADVNMRSKNTNFALLVSLTFTEPFKEPNKYARQIASLVNMIGGDDIIVQRFGDLKEGRRSTVEKINRSTVKPTLTATPGNLGLAIPHDPLQDIIETIEVLNNIVPGIANVDTLLYGLEVKFYSDKPDLDKNLQVKGYDNFYAIGDGAGITRGLAQAGASGIIAARAIIQKENS